jgi:protein-disulfide isomerase
MQKIRKVLFIFSVLQFSLVFLLCTLEGTAFSAVEAEVLKSLPIEEKPLDVAVSLDGTKAYVLGEKNIFIFNIPNYELVNRIPITGNFSHLTLSPDGSSLYLTDSVAKQVTIMQVSEIFNIEIGQSPIIGNKNAPVHVIAFLDYQCPYCANIYPSLQQLVEKYPEKANLIIKHFPLRMHPYAEKAALACLAAEKQNKYKEVSEIYFKNFKNLNDETIKTLAQQVGVNIDKFNKDREDESLKKIINEDMNLSRKIGIRGVPAVFINGKAVKNRSIEALSQMVEQELKKK